MVNDNHTYNDNMKILDIELDTAFDGVVSEGDALIPLIEIYRAN